jgi:hypothetical protein
MKESSAIRVNKALDRTRTVWIVPANQFVYFAVITSFLLVLDVGGAIFLPYVGINFEIDPITLIFLWFWLIGSFYFASQPDPDRFVGRLMYKPIELTRIDRPIRPFLCTTRIMRNNR